MRAIKRNKFVYKNIVFLSLLLILLDKTAFAYNPFSPPEKVQLFYHLIYPDPSLPKIEYKMYINKGNEMIALLDDTFVSQGDQYKNMKVLSVNANRVILLSSHGEKQVIVIDAMQSKLEKLREMIKEVNG